MTKQPDGNFACVYNPTTPGEYKVHVTVGDLHVPGSTFLVTVLEPSAARCKAYGPGLERGVVGDEGKFNVEVPADVDGPGKLSVKVFGPADEAEVALTQDATGKYDVSYTPTTPGDYQVHVTLSDEHIPGSIFHVHVAERPSQRCKAFGPGLEEAVVGDPACFTVNIPSDLDRSAVSVTVHDQVCPHVAHNPHL